MHSLTLKGISYHTNHGYYEEEREEGNSFEVDLIFYADLSEAGKSDELDETIDYQKAEEMVRTVMEGPSVKLIETLCHRIGERLFENFDEARKLEVKVRKLNPPLSADTQYSEVRMIWQK